MIPVGFGSSAGGIDTGDIANSLRLRSAASAYLSRTITTDATSTYFAAVKRGKLGVVSPIFDSNIKFNANDTLTAFGLTTTAVFRDPTSWLFVHVSNGGLYVNGVSYGSVTTSAITNPRIGFDGTNYFDGYMARVGVVAGSSSSYTNFGYLNTEINEWVSKKQSEVKAVVDAGGANSFMLDFDDATSLTTLGYDKSSKGNNWTCNNISLTSGVTYDHMKDVPGNSYCTLNPLNSFSGGVLSYGNLRLAYSSSASSVSGTVAFDIATAKLEWQVTIDSGPFTGIGILPETSSTSTNGQPTGMRWYYGNTGEKFIDVSNFSYGATFTTGDVMKVRIDNGSVTFFKNGVSQGVAWSGLTGMWVPYVRQANTATASVDFGQQGFTPSATYTTLCQANGADVPTALLDPTDHHIDITVTKSGDTNFTLPWNATTYDTFFEIKRRDAAGDWYQIDGLRGYDKILKSNSTAAETTDANVLGVSGTTCTLKSTLPNGTYVISATKAGLASARQTNTDGSITSTVSRNVDSGFSIVLYTGTGANATVGHGLGVAPKMVTVKCRSSGTTYSWNVYHSAIGNTKCLFLENTSAEFTDTPSSLRWNNTSPTSTVFSLGSSGAINQSTKDFVAYCYADSAIQKSFSYTGNGSTDGPNPFLGFKCGRSLFKNAGVAATWMVHDSARDTCNPSIRYISPNAADLEYANDAVDFTASGVKVRVGFIQENGSGNTIIGHAWAATTGKYALAR